MKNVLVLRADDEFWVPHMVRLEISAAGSARADIRHGGHEAQGKAS
jgi:hypothetical protein